MLILILTPIVPLYLVVGFSFGAKAHYRMWGAKFFLKICIYIYIYFLIVSQKLELAPHTPPTPRREKKKKKVIAPTNWI